MEQLLVPDIITWALLALFGLWFKNYLPSYFNERGKILAQKKDIDEVTRSIEEVKTEFIRETEILKTDLQRLLSVEVSHREEERNCIINFYSKYNEWFYALLEINYGAYNRPTLKDLIEKRIYIEKFYAETNVAKAMLKLMVKDQTIIVLSDKLVLQILEFKNWADIRLLGLQQNLENQNSLIEGFLVVLKDLDKTGDLAREMANDDIKLRAEQEKIVKEWYANRNGECAKINPIDLEFRNKVKDYLTQ